MTRAGLGVVCLGLAVLAFVAIVESVDLDDWARAGGQVVILIGLVVAGAGLLFPRKPGDF